MDIWFILIVAIITVAVLVDYPWRTKYLCKRIDNANELYAKTGTKFDKEELLSSLRKKYAAAYFVLVLFHSILYTSLRLS